MKNEQGLRELIIAELRPRIPQYYCKDIKLQKIAGAIITVLKPYLALTEQASAQMSAKVMSDIDDIMKIQLSDPSTKKDPYMQGLANGMIMIKSLITGDEPKFITIPKPQAESNLCDTCQEVCKLKKIRYCPRYKPEPDVCKPTKIEELIHETRWDMDKQIVKKINELVKVINELRSQNETA